MPDCQEITIIEAPEDSHTDFHERLGMARGTHKLDFDGVRSQHVDDRPNVSTTEAMSRKISC
jgi:hypothetical protein